MNKGVIIGLVIALFAICAMTLMGEAQAAYFRYVFYAGLAVVIISYVVGKNRK